MGSSGVGKRLGVTRVSSMSNHIVTIIIRALLTSGGLRKFVSKHLYPVTGAAPPMLDYARAGCDILCGCPLLRRLLLRG